MKKKKWNKIYLVVSQLFLKKMKEKLSNTGIFQLKYKIQINF